MAKPFRGLYPFLSEEEIEQLYIPSVPQDGDTGYFLEVGLSEIFT